MQVVFVASLLTSTPTYAGPQLEGAAARFESPATSAAAGVFNSDRVSRDRALIRALIEQETAKTDLPPDVAEAVVFVESNFNSSLVGRVGEIGLMQVRPETAAMMGFRGSSTELTKPEVNIHYGVTYLSKAWRLAGGDLCRALMKYRAGHGEEIMSSRSLSYCSRARNRLAAVGSPLVIVSEPISSLQRAGNTVNDQIATQPTRPRDVYTHFKQGTPAASGAFWAVHAARIRALKEKLESRWRASHRGKVFSDASLSG